MCQQWSNTAARSEVDILDMYLAIGARAPSGKPRVARLG